MHDFVSDINICARRTTGFHYNYPHSHLLPIIFKSIRHRGVFLAPIKRLIKRLHNGSNGSNVNMLSAPADRSITSVSDLWWQYWQNSSRDKFLLQVVPHLITWWQHQSAACQWYPQFVVAAKAHVFQTLPSLLACISNIIRMDRRMICPFFQEQILQQKVSYEGSLRTCWSICEWSRGHSILCMLRNTFSTLIKFISTSIWATYIL